MKRLFDEWRGKARADKLFFAVVAAALAAWLLVAITVSILGAAGAAS